MCIISRMLPLAIEIQMIRQKSDHRAKAMKPVENDSCAAVTAKLTGAHATFSAARIKNSLTFELKSESASSSLLQTRETTHRQTTFRQSFLPL